MLEFVSEAFVLGCDNLGECDSRVHLYTKDFGKITAKAKSLKKITSKLAGHLQPLNLVIARLMEKNGVQVLDALTLEKGKISPQLANSLLLVKELAAEGQQDFEIWQVLKDMANGKENIGVKEVLAVLGFDPSFSKCGNCGKKKANVFSLEDTSFYCRECAGSGILKVYV